jgi:hypothetical protein
VNKRLVKVEYKALSTSMLRSERWEKRFWDAILKKVKHCQILFVG